MQIKASQNIAFCFCTADPSTGSGLDPTTPGTATTGKLYINGVQNAASVTLTDDAASSAGITKVSYTVPGTVAEGDTVQCLITATVGGIAASSVVRDDTVVTKFPGELAVSGDAMTLTAGERTAIGTAVWATTARTLTSFGSLGADAATAVWGAATRTLTAFGFTVTAGTVSDKSGYNLATSPPSASDIKTAVESSTILAKEATVAAIPSPWDAVATAHVTAGTFGYYLKRIFGWLFWKQAVTTTSRAFYDADNTTVLGTQTLSGDGTTTTTVSKEA
jgi:hypothetical protein